MFGERQALRLPTVDYSYRDFAYDQSPVIHVLRQMPDIASTSAKTFAEYVVASVSSLFMPSPIDGTSGLAFAVAHLVIGPTATKAPKVPSESWRAGKAEMRRDSRRAGDGVDIDSFGGARNIRGNRRCLLGHPYPHRAVLGRVHIEVGELPSELLDRRIFLRR